MFEPSIGLLALYHNCRVAQIELLLTPWNFKRGHYRKTGRPGTPGMFLPTAASAGVANSRRDAGSAMVWQHLEFLHFGAPPATGSRGNHTAHRFHLAKAQQLVARLQ